ncbi:MAG TPA: heme utilization cystosolic carrier protein HutX [Gammaproteobacteria bacterium]|nr:heme utilization cystosolic carrier protein HutX [Gammaproteobacteria bacterium]
MTDQTNTSLRERISRRLAERTDGVLEAIATEYGVSLQTVVECLASKMWTRVDGAHFIEVMTDIASWGEVTLIAHSKDAILEFSGPLPEGRVGHGLYNLKGGGALSGHLRHEHCKAIIFLRRPFMGTETASVQFFNAAGEAMFKIFVGRDERRQLRPEQLARFAALEQRFPALAEAV